MGFENTLDFYQDFNITQLNIDEAWLNISSTFHPLVWIYFVSNDCYECPFQKLLEDPVVIGHSYRTILSVQHGSQFRFRSSGKDEYVPVENDSDQICDVDGSAMGEFGVYTISMEQFGECRLHTDLEPVNIYSPIPVIFGFWLLTGFFFSFLSCYWSRLASRYPVPVQSIESQTEDSQSLISALESEDKRNPDDSGLCDKDNDENPESGVLERHETSSSVSNDEDEKQKQLLECESPDKRRRKENRPKSRRLQKQSGQKFHGKRVRTTVDDSTNAPCSSASMSEQIQQKSSNKPIRKERLRSLDTLRGLCIVIMIFVDDGGGGYYFFRHCTWNGLYVADLAFPWFLWICGVCIPFSIQAKLKNQSLSKRSIIEDFAIRSAKLILLGIVVNTSTRATAVPLESLRVPGVLQRFGICYFVGSFLYLTFSANKILAFDNPQQSGDGLTWRHQLNDLFASFIPFIIVTLGAVLHSLLVFLLPVPGCPTGYLGPAGLHNNNKYPAICVGGAAGYLDRFLFGVSHIHSRPTSQKVYGSGAFDPEGSLGILTSFLHIWLGVQAGIIFLSFKSVRARVIRFLSWSLICGTVGVVLCGGYQNNGWIPVNKNLWSLSFVFITSSAAFLLMAMLYYSIDELRIWSGKPLREAGMNSILLYLGHEVCHAMLPWHYSIGRMRTHTSRLVESTWGTALWIMLAMFLHQKQLFFVV